MAETLQSLKWKLILYGVGSLFILVFTVCAGILPPFIGPDTQEEWFQRSGSLMVIIGVILEYKLLLIDGHLNITGTVWDLPFKAPELYEKWYKVIKGSAALAVLGGTFIWGYGDILFSA
jgi:hypothetical protein